MADYWIKLYIEILDDSKMAVLPDRLWRRVVELFLLAGRYHQDGSLPETSQLAWALRLPTDDLEMDLKQIATTGIVERQVNGWIIPKFKQRQAASTNTERSQAFREKQRKEQYYTEDETQLKRNVAQINRLTDTDTDTEAPDPYFAMQRTIEGMTGLLMTQADIQPINEMLKAEITAEDLQGAMEFLKGKKTVRGASDLLKSAIVAHAKRIQAGKNGGIPDYLVGRIGPDGIPFQVTK